jgi:copper(I)-binding protein
MNANVVRIVAVPFLIVAAACVAASKPMAMPMAKAARSAPINSAAAHVDGAWIRAAPPGAAMMAGYMAVHNDGKMPLRLVSTQSDTFGMVELHRSLIVDGMDTMRRAGEQVIPAGGTLKIAPGGLHLMLMQPKRALHIGDSVHFQLNFGDGSAAEVDAKVAASPPAR